jgi:hypothetical protein
VSFESTTGGARRRSTGRRSHEASAPVEVVGGALGACFTATRLGPSSVQVDASCSTGDIDRYGWWPAFVSNLFRPRSSTRLRAAAPSTTRRAKAARATSRSLVVLDAANNLDETEIVIPDVP